MTNIFDDAKQRLRARKATWLGTGVGGLAAIGGAFAFSALSGTSALEATIQKSFPNSQVTSVSCKTDISSLCEIIIGRNVFYSTRNGRYVVVGSIIDLSKKLDLTDERLRQLAAVDAVTTKGRNETLAAPVATERVTISLPKANAIVHNPGAPVKVSVFSDFSCGYCRAFFTQLSDDPSIEVTEYPIAILGPESLTKARLVLCAKDRLAAAASAYGEGKITASSDCKSAEQMVEANTAFARDHGITGTPTIVREDGKINQGYLDKTALRTFAEART